MQLIIKREDGGVSLGPIAKDADPKEQVRKWQEATVGQTAVSWRVSDEVISRPASRAFRDAWTDDNPGEQVDVDMPKARAIKTGKVRAERNIRLVADDLEYMKADEADDDTRKRRVANRKKKLRDLPADIQSDLDALDTPEVLEAYQPAWPE
jgi:hypothetical protein